MLAGHGTKRVIIVGGGFAGLNCARHLATHRGISVTLIDKNNYQQFQPLLYQVATGTLSPDNAAFNLRSVLAEQGIDVAMATVQSVDLASRTAITAEGRCYQGDFLVLAAGAEANFFGVPGVHENAFPLYSLSDAERLRSKLIETLETADRRLAQESVPLSFVVIGGGATGVEVAGAIGDLLQRTPTHVFKHARLREASITLIDHASTVLGPFCATSRHYAQTKLQERGVHLLMGVSVSEVQRSHVRLSDGTRIPAHLVIWAGGLKASTLSSSLGITPGRGGRVDVLCDLRVDGYPGVYALGDFANCQSASGDVLPQLASVAQQAGRHCAKNILATLDGTPCAPFDYIDKGIMAMVGRNAAVAEVGSMRHAITGPLAFTAWLAVHALLLTTLRARVWAVMEWAWEYFGHVHVNAILNRPSTDWPPNPSVGRKDPLADTR